MLACRAAALCPAEDSNRSLSLDHPVCRLACTPPALLFTPARLACCLACTPPTLLSTPARPHLLAHIHVHTLQVRQLRHLQLRVSVHGAGGGTRGDCQPERERGGAPLLPAATASGRQLPAQAGASAFGRGGRGGGSHIFDQEWPAG